MKKSIHNLPDPRRVPIKKRNAARFFVRSSAAAGSATLAVGSVDVANNASPGGAVVSQPLYKPREKRKK
jgi:hypothetical protein